MPKRTLEILAELESSSALKGYLLEKIFTAASKGTLAGSEVLNLLQETIHCIGGTLETTMVSVKLIRHFLEKLRDSLDQEVVIFLASKTLMHLQVPDAQERYLIGCILHSLYFNNPRHRNELRVLFGDFLAQGTDHATADLLDIILLIIQGFSTPLKDSHLDYCRTYLIPLLHHPNLPKYFTNLRRCLTQYVLMTPCLTHELVFNLLQICWNPKDSFGSQIFDFAVDLLPSLSEDEYVTIQMALFQRMSLFIKTEHVETGLKPFSNVSSSERIMASPRMVQAFLLPALEHGILVHTGVASEKCVAALQLLVRTRFC